MKDRYLDILTEISTHLGILLSVDDPRPDDKQAIDEIIRALETAIQALKYLLTN